MDVESGAGDGEGAGESVGKGGADGGIYAASEGFEFLSDGVGNGALVEGVHGVTFGAQQTGGGAAATAQAADEDGGGGRIVHRKNIRQL